MRISPSLKAALRHVTVVAAMLIASLAVPGGAAAQGLRSVSLTFDNDGLALWIPVRERSDWYYTHGTRIEATGGWAWPAGVPGVGALAPCGESGGSEKHPCVITRVALTHDIYTPRTLFSYDPFDPPGRADRPYAGWLGAAVEAERMSPGRSTTVALELGVTGAPALGREAHLAIHRWLDKAEPVGWEYQLPFELAGAVSWREARRWSVGGISTPAAALEPHVEATLGTLRTSGEVGVDVRFGWHVIPGVEWIGAEGDEMYFIIVAGADRELVLRDLFLDGTTFADSARTEKERVLGRTRLRLLMGGRTVGLEFGFTKSTREFVTQDEPHVVATVGLTVRR